MKLVNLHPTISDETIRAIYRHVRPPQGCERVTLRIARAIAGRHHGGSAWVWGARGGRRLSAKVSTTTKPSWYYPYQYGQFAGRKYVVRDCVERLVVIMAHEARHFWQFAVPQGWRVWGARGRFSEIDAEAYAIRKLREWRNR